MLDKYCFSSNPYTPTPLPPYTQSQREIHVILVPFVQQTVSPAEQVAPPEGESQQASAPAENPSDALGEQAKVAANTKQTLIKSNKDPIPFQKFTQHRLTVKDQEQTDLVGKYRKDANAAVAKSRQDGDVVADGRSVGYKPGIEYLLKQGGSRYYDTIITMTKNASQEERRSVSGDLKMRELIVKHLSPPQATAVMAAVMQGEQRWQESGGSASEFMLRFLDSNQENLRLWNKPNKINHIQRIKVKDIFKDKDEGIVQIGRPITTVINSQKSPWKE